MGAFSEFWTYKIISNSLDGVHEGVLNHILLVSVGTIVVRNIKFG
jgi:hypothetical protein